MIKIIKICCIFTHLVVMMSLEDKFRLCLHHHRLREFSSHIPTITEEKKKRRAKYGVRESQGSVKIYVKDSSPSS